MGPLGGVKYSQRVPANDKCFVLISDKVAAGGIFPSSGKKEHKDGCVSVFPLPSISFSISDGAGLL